MKKPAVPKAKIEAPKRGQAVVRAVGPDDLDDVRAMFREYAQGIMACHCLDGFQQEVEGLPGEYGEPKGRLLVAAVGRKRAGCVGLRPVKDETCEMKRLYVRPGFRGKKIGRALVERALVEAKAAGYSRMVLDTLPIMKEALSLYRSLGFQTTEEYWQNPTPQAICMQRTL